MENTYTLEVHKIGGRPCFIVDVKSEILSDFCVFSSMRDAQNYIKETKNSLSNYGISLKYDFQRNVNAKLLNLYKNAAIGLFSKTDNRQIYIGGLNNEKSNEYSMGL